MYIPNALIEQRDEALARIAALESELAEAVLRAKCAEKDELIRESRWEWEQACERERAERAARVEAEELAVWAVRGCVYDGRPMGLRIMLELDSGKKRHFDATCNADILRALREAKGAGNAA